MGDTTVDRVDRIDAARAAFARHDWEQAYQQLRAVDAETSLRSEDLERLAEAARWSHRFDEMFELFARATDAYEQAADRRGAARTALQLCMEHYLRNNEAQMSGWFGRAGRLLEDDTESPEYGLLLWGSARMLFDVGDIDGARQLLEQVVEHGRRVGDRSVEALGRQDLGHTLIIEGRPAEGLAMIDEATALAMSGQVMLWVSGQIYCSTIWACRNLGDWRRAGEWTDESNRWCERQSVTGFSGLCRFHRAEVRRVRGALDDAERDVQEAIDELASARPREAGWGYGELGEIRRRRGNTTGAAEAFGRALDAGYDPQPGLALLRLDEGNPTGALHAIDRALTDESALAQEGRAYLLPARVTIAIAAGDLDAARDSLDELEERARTSRSAAFAAAAAAARGELALAGNRAADAARELRRAWQGWLDVDAPYESAQARVLLARAYRLEGDDAAAELELESALSTFDRIGAARESAKVASLLAKPAAARAVRTFMFTDIVNSTKLVDLLGDEAWENLLAWHDRSLRTCFERHHGDEVKHEGDGFFVAFPDPISAIDCARHIQKNLADHRREHGFAPQLRIGVHAAEVTEREGDYGGKGVHTAARIGAAAGADEVLVSREALDGLDDQVATSDARALELKGFAEPVEVATVDWR